MLCLFLSASAYTNKLSSLENHVDQLQEELNELKLEAKGSSAVRSAFEAFDKDEDSMLSLMKEFTRMNAEGVISLEKGGWDTAGLAFLGKSCNKCVMSYVKKGLQQTDANTKHAAGSASRRCVPVSRPARPAASF